MSSPGRVSVTYRSTDMDALALLDGLAVERTVIRLGILTPPFNKMQTIVLLIGYTMNICFVKLLIPYKVLRNS